ncbi:hypothetical protein Acr_06g0012000 [Actinidia rufa]|uniref:Senescence-specific cysteine protease sag39 n=1 Tax=Actinidia rufa TaxID=165716 RepID=A0A7J0ESF2_9ERIC|nr:hypothetical protein Acr_06g0012000 [Actinidia rufa]
MAGGLELVRERMMQLEALAGASPDEAFCNTFSEMLDDMMTLSGALKERLNDVELEISLVKKAVAGSVHGPDVSHKVKVPEPKFFGGVRSSKELENFLWDMEQYFKASRISDDEKVLITSMHLSRDAKFW